MTTVYTLIPILVMASATSSNASFYDHPDETSESSSTHESFDTEDEGVVVAPTSPVSAPVVQPASVVPPVAMVQSVPIVQPAAIAHPAPIVQPAPPLPTVLVPSPPIDTSVPLSLVRTSSIGEAGSSSSNTILARPGALPSWEEFLHVTQTSLVQTQTMMQQAAQVIVRMDARQDRMEQNHDMLRQQQQQLQEQIVQLRTQMTQNQSRRPDGELSRELLMLVEFIVRYGMDTKRGRVVAFPIFTSPRAGSPEKLYLAICTPLVHEAFMAMFKDQWGDKFKNKTEVNTMLHKLNHQQLSPDHRFLDKLFAHTELRRNMPTKKVFVLADVRYFFNAWQSVAGREQLQELSPRDLDCISFSRNQRSVWTDEAELHWGKQDAKYLTKMAWNLPVQREVLVAHNRAVHAFMREIATLQDRASEWIVPEGEVFHFSGFNYVSPHQCKVKKALSLLPRSRHEYRSSSSEESTSEEEVLSSQVSASPPPPAGGSSGSSGSSSSSGGAGTCAPRPQGKEYAALVRQQRQLDKKRRSKAKRSKRRRDRSSSSADDRLRSSEGGSDSTSETSSSSEFEDTRHARRKKHKK